MSTTDKATDKKASTILKAMGNPYRFKILSGLTAGERNVSDINSEMPLSQPALSQHLAKLKRDGLVIARREERKIFYSIRHPEVLTIMKHARVMATIQRAA